MTSFILINWNKDKINLKSRKVRGEDRYQIEASIKEPKKKRSTIKHKGHSWKRETICGLKYDNTIINRFLFENLVGHWSKVTCKKCLASRKRYERELKKREGKR